MVTDEANVYKILEIWPNLPDLKWVFVVGECTENRIANFWSLIGKGSPVFDPVMTKADDPALIIYTSGTTEPPKGAFHAHRVLLGHLPGVELPHNFFPQEHDSFGLLLIGHGLEVCLMFFSRV